jgi:hypothetical protein
MPNSFAYLALILWPLISIWLYKRYEVIPATFWTIVGGYLFLPVGVDFDFPLIPALNKETIPAIMAFIGCKYLAKKDVTILPPKGLARNLLYLFFIGTIGMLLTNSEPVREVYRFIPGLTYRDMFSVIMLQVLLLLPFTLAMQLVKTHEEHVMILKLMVVAGLLYSALILFEVRMSPQLHKWIYGFFPHTWGQQIRYGGFRPVVFLGHGLWVSIFLAIVFGASLVLSKLKIKMSMFANGVVVTYFAGLLILAKGFGAILLSIVLFVSISFLSNNLIIKIALAIGIIAIAYPILSILGVFPHDFIVGMIEPINEKQAGSLQFRFNQEDQLLERAKEKFLFGWGGWDRNRLVDSVTDGYWIILVGKYGLVGFSAIFGLMLSVIIRARKMIDYLSGNSEKVLLASHCLLIAIIMVDQIPNDSNNPLFWFVIGALMGRNQHIIGEALKLGMTGSKPLTARVQ